MFTVKYLRIKMLALLMINLRETFLYGRGGMRGLSHILLFY